MFINLKLVHTKQHIRYADDGRLEVQLGRTTSGSEVMISDVDDRTGRSVDDYHYEFGGCVALNLKSMWRSGAFQDFLVKRSLGRVVLHIFL